MRFQVQRVIRSGQATLDAGISDLVVYADDSGTWLYSSTGRNGGLAGYRIGEGGQVQVHTTLTFPPGLAGRVGERLVLDETGPQARLVVGGDSGGLIAYGLRDNQAIGGQAGLGWDTARELARGEDGAPLLEALVTMTGRGGDLLPPGRYSDQIVELRAVTVQMRDYVVIACAETDSVATFLRDPASGRLIPADQYGAEQGLGIQAPTGMEVVEAGGQTFVLLVSAGSSSLSVLRIAADGRLVPADHLIDTESTRFAGAQAVAVAQSGAHTFVITGGTDHGVSLFLMLPDGRLVWLDTLADSHELSMHNVSAISAVIENGRLHVFVGSQRDAGITHLTLDLENLGVQRSGDAARAGLVSGGRGDDIVRARSDGDTLDGGAGNDVLVSGPGRTVMRGGEGADIFVLRANTTRAEIQDFARGVDRLDLSDLPMLRALEQLTLTATSNGARIEYRGVTIILRAADGNPLSAEDIFPHGLGGADRIPVITRRAAPEPGREIVGTGGNDRLTDGGGNDTIWGLNGNDMIELSGGDDLVYAGGGNDTVIGASTGNATLYGGAGNDVLYATGGNNWLGGGEGNDTLYGGSGNDTLWGAEGNDLIYTGGGRNEAWGGDGDDTIHGGDGGNMLGGGRGNDVIRGGRGNDTIWGAAGNDLIHGTAGRNEIWGGPGNDTIHGGTGDDILGGGLGNDLIYGGAGDDTLYGGEGDDTLWGGAGADTFVFYRNQDASRIMDFNPAEGDTLWLARGLWLGAGALSADEVVSRFGSVNAAGDLVLDFSSRAGTVIILMGFDDMEALATQIEIL